MSTEKFGRRNKTELKAPIERRQRLLIVLTTKVNEDEHLEIYGGLKGEIGMKTCMHGPMYCPKMLKWRFRVGDLDMPESRKKYTSSRDEDDAQMCPCGKATESKTHIAGACGMYKEERGVLEEEMRKSDECDREVWYTTVDRSEETVAILGDTSK